LKFDGQEDESLPVQGQMVLDPYLFHETTAGPFRCLLRRNHSILSQIQQVIPSRSREKKKLEEIMPQLNLDGKIYTPLFILEEDRVRVA
jgi:hypothetical protein